LSFAPRGDRYLCDRAKFKAFVSATVILSTHKVAVALRFHLAMEKAAMAFSKKELKQRCQIVADAPRYSIWSQLGHRANRLEAIKHSIACMLLSTHSGFA
jgi:hypothetical protein